MNETTDILSLLDKLTHAISQKDATEIQRIIETTSTMEVLHTLMELDCGQRDMVFLLLNAESAAKLIRLIPDSEVTEVFSNLPLIDSVQIMAEFDTHAQVEILNDLDEEKSEQILNSMTQTNAQQLRIIRQYLPDTAGGMMNTETLTFRPQETVGKVLRTLIDKKEEHDSDFKFYPYVVDAHNRLLGVLSILKLLGEATSKPIATLMVAPTSVHVAQPIEELTHIFDETNYFSLPVIDNDGILVGTVFKDDVFEKRQETSDSNALKSQGLIEEELRTMPVLLRSRRRLAWLSVNIVLNMIAASVISVYEQTLSAVIAIAVFLPMVSDMSGCSGNQAVAVSMRELSLGLIRPKNMMRVWFKEMSVGIINGIALGILIALVAWVWKGNPYLGVVIGIALALNTIIAVSIGGTIPLFLKRFGVDPAIASGPLLTTVTDMVGFFLVLSLATLMMPYLI